MKLFVNVETGEIIAATMCPVLSDNIIHHVIRHDGVVTEVIAHRQDETINPVVLQRLGVTIIR